MQRTRPQRESVSSSHTSSHSRRYPKIRLAWLLGLAFAALSTSVQADYLTSVIIDQAGDGLGKTMFSPRSVAVGPDGSAYVTSSNAGNVFRIQPSGTITAIMDSSGDGIHLNSAADSLAVDASGQVYVGSRGFQNVFQISPSGTITQILDSTGDGFGNTFGGVAVGSTDGVAIDPAGNVYAASPVSDNVFRISPSGTITEFVDTASSGGLLVNVLGVAADSSGNVFVSAVDGGDGNVIRITPSGTITEILDVNGAGGPGLFGSPEGLTVGPDGSVYVAGAATDNVFRITPSGTISEIVDPSGDGAGNPLDGPRDIDVGSDGRVYVIAVNSSNLLAVETNGTVVKLADFASENMLSVAVDASGEAFAVSGSEHVVYKVSKPGCSNGVDDDGDLLVDFPDDLGCVSALDSSELGICEDGLDNDGDGVTDHPADPGCTSAVDGNEREPGLVCDDGLDNDGDTFADAPNDPECNSAFDDSELANCSDGIDNDSDGLTDFPADPQCASAADLSELGDCEDGFDNDADGLSDFPNDPGCTSLADSAEREASLLCDDGVDNDGDGFNDFPDDPGCTGVSDPSELGTTQCDDGIDNDSDGLTDFPDDGGCSSPTDSTESSTPQCDDGQDNDSDGLTDFPDDPGCSSANDGNEREPGLVCDDGVDNDGDGRADFAFSNAVSGSDRGCRGPGDPDERSPDLPCDDGIDNDGDGQADFPNDLDCLTASWPSETDLALESACLDTADNDGDGVTDADDPGCFFGNDPFESSLITTSGGVITAYLCETTSPDCEVDAKFSVSNAVMGTGRMAGPGGKTSYFVDIEIPQVSFVGSLGNVARVELTDVTLDGDFWLMPFLSDFLRGFAFSSALVGTIETFDGADNSISGPAAFVVPFSDLGSGSLFNSISHCTSSSVETGQCTLFFDSLGSFSTLDVNGTPLRLVAKFDSIALAGTCGNGVVDPGEECDDGNEVSGDCCSAVCDAPVPTGGACDDGDACTQLGSCDISGQCQGATPLVCDDSNGCTDDACDPIAGCEFVNNTAPCDDAAFCNGADVCGGGVCLHTGDPCPGPDGDGSCAESCDEAANACTAADPDGSSCTDSDACTTTDTCTSGSCTPGTPLVCNDANLCTDDSCNPAAGCEFVDNTDPCDDALFCNGADTCSGGACLTHAGDPCPGPDGDASCTESCDEGADACTAADPDGSNCTDANACTEADTCASGSCTPGVAPDCDDGDECTADSCDELTGCMHDPIAGCPELVPTGSSALWLLTALTLVGIGLWKLARGVRDPLA